MPAQYPWLVTGKYLLFVSVFLSALPPTYGGVGSGQFIRGRCHSRLQEVKLGLRSLAAKVSIARSAYEQGSS